MTCNCIKAINDKLSEKNTMIAPVFTADGDETCKIATVKIDPKVRQGPITLVPSFCPFCGRGLRK